jgi:DNA-binding CsgD family transcriptional regulator
MDTQLNRKCLEVLHASTVKDLSKQLVAFAQNLGFGTVAATVVTDHSPTLTEFQTVSNVPSGYLKEFENLELGRIDPVSQHCKRSSGPIVWSQKTYATAKAQVLWECQAPFGYRSGLAIGMHFGRGRHFLFGAEWNHDYCEQVANFKNIFEDILTFAEHAQAAAFELSTAVKRDANEEWSLTNSELEALRWTMDGKTSWEITKMMPISERHATLLLRRAMQKLDCSSKYETVLRAIRLGLIECQ